MKILKLLEKNYKKYLKEDIINCKNKIVILIPCFNEEKTIIDICKRAKNLDMYLLLMINQGTIQKNY